MFLVKYFALNNIDEGHNLLYKVISSFEKWQEKKDFFSFFHLSSILQNTSLYFSFDFLQVNFFRRGLIYKKILKSSAHIV